MMVFRDGMTKPDLSSRKLQSLVPRISPLPFMPLVIRELREGHLLKASPRAPIGERIGTGAVQKRRQGALAAFDVIVIGMIVFRQLGSPTAYHETRFERQI